MSEISGISIIVFCYNSERFIARNLQYVSKLTRLGGLDYELLVLDNNSTDHTREVAIQTWTDLGNPFRMRVVSELKQGLSFARIKAVEQAKYNLLVFVDDDNFLSENYLEVAIAFMNANPDVGICGGQTIAEYEKTPASWFFDYQGAIAIGSQGTGVQDSRESKGFVWGAGMVVRREALQDAFSRGFSFINTGRKGNQLASSEDIELCYAVIAGGYKVFYNENLILTHYIPEKRIEWPYIRSIILGYGSSTIWLDLFQWFQKGKFLGWPLVLILLYHHLVFLKLLLKRMGRTSDIDQIQPEYPNAQVQIVELSRIKAFFAIRWTDYLQKVKIIRNFYKSYA